MRTEQVSAVIVETPMAVALRISPVMTRTERDGAQAFERLFLAEYARVVGIAHRVLADAHEAEDVAQEVFNAYYGKHAPDAPYAAAWLYAAAAHRALNAIRGKKRRLLRETKEAVSATRLNEVSEVGFDPQEHAVREEQRHEARKLLATLPERQSTALILRYSGLSYAEVAAALHMPADQVGTLLRRAEAALRKEIQDGAR
jgi:RNA polymerase sigma-70 factor (ECF subfamily)